MYKKYIFLPLVFFLYFCGGKANKQKEVVDLSLTNDQIHYLETDIHYPLETTTYHSIKELLKARNQICYKITNNTEDDYVFLIDPTKLNYDELRIFKNESIYRIMESNHYPSYMITNKKGEQVGDISGFLNFATKKSNERLEHLNEIDRLNDTVRKHFGPEGLSQTKPIVLIKSGEKKNFSKSIFLPIIEEPSMENRASYKVLFLSQETYHFQLGYNVNQKIIDKFLTVEEKEYFKENNIKIFKGELHSEKLDLVPR